MSDMARLFSDGEAYEQFMGRWSRELGRHFIEWCGVKSGVDWLDVGCGNGAFTETAIEMTKPKSITGVDPSAGQIAYAKQRAGAAMGQFDVADAMALPFGSQAFDCVVMALVLTFVPDAAGAVAEMKRVAKSGGMIAAYMWDMPAFGSPIGPLQHAMKEMDIPMVKFPSAQASKRENMEALWRGAGLKHVATTILPFSVRYPSFNDYWATVNLPIGPHAAILKSLPVEQNLTLRNRLETRLKPEADGSIVIACICNAAKGWA